MKLNFLYFYLVNLLFVNLLIWKYHYDYHHVGISELINFIRQKFYFPRMRQTLRKILRSCVLCKRLQAIHFKQAPIASLPKVRVTECDPFTTVGVDLSGSFNVKISKNIIKKCYIVLFTCAVYRAVHLDLFSIMESNPFYWLFVGL